MSSSEEGRFNPQFAYPLGDEDVDGTKWIMFILIEEDDVQRVLDHISDPEHRESFERWMCFLRDQLLSGLKVGECLVEGRTISEMLGRKAA